MTRDWTGSADWSAAKGALILVSLSGRYQGSHRCQWRRGEGGNGNVVAGADL